jgi:hypothetical protein
LNHFISFDGLIVDPLSNLAWYVQVKLLFDENNMLDKANKRLWKKCKERDDPSSGEKHTSSPSSKAS